MSNDLALLAITNVIRRIEALDYDVSVHRLSSSLVGTIGPSIEMHAINPPQVHVARIADSDDAAGVYECARLLAKMVGIEIDG